MEREDGGDVSQLATPRKYPDVSCGTSEMDQDGSVLMKAAVEEHSQAVIMVTHLYATALDRLLKTEMRNSWPTGKNSFLPSLQKYAQALEQILTLI